MKIVELGFGQGRTKFHVGNGNPVSIDLFPNGEMNCSCRHCMFCFNKSHCQYKKCLEKWLKVNKKEIKDLCKGCN